VTNKLSLDAEALRVESFSTAARQTERGTVNAHAVSQGANTCYCTSINIGCFCSERQTCWDCV